MSGRQVSRKGDDLSPERLARQRKSASRFGLGDPELVVEMLKMLFDGCIGDDELVRDLAHGRRLDADLRGCCWSAQGDQDVELPPRQIRMLASTHVVHATLLAAFPKG